MEDRLTPPFTVHWSDGAFWVEDAAGAKFAFTYFRNQPIVGTDSSGKVSRRLAEKIAKFIARQATVWAQGGETRHG
jgi:hypothetical protein